MLDFATSGRSGRRNALPDILGSPAGVGPTDLPLKLAELTLKGRRGGGRAEAGTPARLGVCGLYDGWDGVSSHGDPR